MSHWDRLGLLELVDTARNCMNDTSISDVQRNSLHALVNRYAVKTQSIEASRQDVIALGEEISKIVSPLVNPS